MSVKWWFKALSTRRQITKSSRSRWRRWIRKGSLFKFKQKLFVSASQATCENDDWTNSMRVNKLPHFSACRRRLCCEQSFTGNWSFFECKQTALYATCHNKPNPSKYFTLKFTTPPNVPLQSWFYRIFVKSKTLISNQTILNMFWEGWRALMNLKTTWVRISLNNADRQRSDFSLFIVQINFAFGTNKKFSKM